MSGGRADQGIHCGHAAGERQGQKKDESEKFLHQRPLVAVVAPVKNSSEIKVQ